MDLTSHTYFPAFVPTTAWLRHGPFAIWLVRAMKPDCIVELGTHFGFSYFCFCQAVSEANLKTTCFAVDTWTGDEHAGFYDQEVYESVNNHNSRYRTFSILLRKTFSEALSDIKDGTVDLLHIDGRHFYDDIKEDFESWIPKLSSRAVVLFHDTEVKERNFGVWKYWSEVSQSRVSLNFPYQHGLGVLFWGSETAEGLKSLVGNLKDETYRSMVITHFGQHGEIFFLSHQLALLQRELRLTKKNLADARKRPLKQLRRLLAHKLFLAMSKATAPFSPRTAARLAHSAAERDPRGKSIAPAGISAGADGRHDFSSGRHVATPEGADGESG